ncbi:MAG: PSP1 domain-containing protein [Thermodesulfobacteriota bacterium]
MKKVVGVRFKAAGKIYDFDAGAFVLNIGDTVIVETEHGLGFGTVASLPVQVEEESLATPLKKICRLATENDFAQQESNLALEKQANDFCQEQIKLLRLEMNLFAVESTFDANKLTFFFTAEGRVDFRQLVKILVKEFRTRIEMRQVGIRNQAKMCGGIGRCGRQLCCSTFLSKFEPVSIRMAKDQGLSLNPTKISGQCGRLMCCLTFENDTYVDLRQKAPKIGKPVTVSGRSGKIVRQNVICNRVVIQFEDGVETEIDIEAIKNTGEQESI